MDVWHERRAFGADMVGRKFVVSIRTGLVLVSCLWTEEGHVLRGVDCGGLAKIAILFTPDFP